MADRTPYHGLDLLIRTVVFFAMALLVRLVLRSWADWDRDVVALISIALGILAAGLGSEAWQRGGRRSRVR